MNNLWVGLAFVLKRISLLGAVRFKAHNFFLWSYKRMRLITQEYGTTSYQWLGS